MFFLLDFSVYSCYNKKRERGDIMEIRTLSDAELAEVYRERMIFDFPRDERKPLHMIRSALRRGQYQCLGLFDGEKIAAYAFFVVLQAGAVQQILLDYFAVDAARRGRGIGSQFLQMLQSRFCGVLLIEVEDPVSAQDASERQIRLRRKQFYLRNGCAETAVSADVFGVRYLLLEMPVPELHPAETIRQTYASLYRSFLPAAIYAAQIRIH